MLSIDGFDEAIEIAENRFSLMMLQQCSLKGHSNLDIFTFEIRFRIIGFNLAINCCHLFIGKKSSKNQS